MVSSSSSDCRILLATLLACGGVRAADPPPAPSAPSAAPPAPTTAVTPTPTPADVPPELADDRAIDGSGRRVVFRQAWEKNAPDSVKIARKVCLPAGRWVFELHSSPTLDGIVTIDDQGVIAQVKY